MALAIKFQEMVGRGEVRDYADLARLGFVTRARVTQIVNLLHLAPDIQKAILVDSESIPLRETQLRSVVRILHWDDQRKALADLEAKADVTGDIFARDAALRLQQRT
jgi:hypothetical protein